MPRVPTDYQILNLIYDRYYETFASYQKGDDTRGSKLYVPIDLQGIANQLGVDLDIVFGRLYYDMEKRYGYEMKDNVHVPFFSLQTAGDRHVVNFPYLASILAQLRDENRKCRLATTMSIVSFITSMVTFGLQILGRMGR